MSDFASTLRRGNADLELAVLDWAIAVAPRSFDIPATFTNSSGVIQPLTNFLPLGNIDKKAAVKIANAITSTPVETYGEQTATRVIRKQRDITIDWTMQETRLINLSLYWGQDFSGVTADPTSGEVNIPLSEMAFNPEWRLIMIGLDGEENAEKYTIIDGPRMQLQKSGDITTNDDGIQMYPVTMQLLKDFDPSYNYAARISYAGAGWAPLVGAAGFVAAATSIDLMPSAATIAPGDELQLTVRDNNGNLRTADCTFTSATTADATVSSAGVVTGVADGSSVVTAHLGGLTDTCTVTVAG